MRKQFCDQLCTQLTEVGQPVIRTKAILNIPKTAITDNALSTIFSVNLPVADNYFGGAVHVTVFGKSASTHRGVLVVNAQFAAINIAGTITATAVMSSNTKAVGGGGNFGAPAVDVLVSGTTASLQLKADFQGDIPNELYALVTVFPNTTLAL